MKPTDAARRRPSFGRVIGAMLRLAYQTHPRLFFVYLLSSLLFTALLIVNLHLVRGLLDQLPLLANGQIALGTVIVTILVLGGVNVLDTLMNGAANLAYEYLASLTEAQMTATMGKKAGRLPLIQFEAATLYDGIEKAQHGRRRGFDAMETAIFALIFHGGYFLFLALYLITLEPLLVVGIFAAFLPVALSRLLRASAFYQTENRVAPLRREFAHYEACLTDRTYCKETRTTGAVPFFRRRYDETLAAYNREMWRTEMRSGAIDLGLRVLTLAGYVGLLLLLVHFVISGRISPGLFGAVYFAMDAIFKWFGELFDRLGFAFENAGYGANYLDFLATPQRADGKATVVWHRGIVLQGVHFRYPGATTNAVEEITLTIRPGEAVAIVGENGAGKSSLVRLIAGLYQPDRGVVQVGGVDLSEAVDATRWRGLSAVFQQFQRYRMTLLDNVRIADPPADATTGRTAEQERAITALTQAGFNTRPDATAAIDLDTMLAREFGGVDLSGGEWQRVAIARGLYRPHDTVILDEPTAAIDPLEEDRVYRMFLDAARGKTAIIVTHRLGLARLADRILVMDQGRIVQDGNHAELMATAGPYARMFRAQAAWYERSDGS